MIILFLKAAEERSGFACPETLHGLEAGIPQPFHLVFQWGPLAVEIDEAAATFDQGKDVAIDALDDFWTADVVDRDGRDNSFEGTGELLAPARLGKIAEGVVKASFEVLHTLLAEVRHLF